MQPESRKAETTSANLMVTPFLNQRLHDASSSSSAPCKREQSSLRPGLQLLHRVHPLGAARGQAVPRPPGAHREFLALGTGLVGLAKLRGDDLQGRRWRGPSRALLPGPLTSAAIAGTQHLKDRFARGLAPSADIAPIGHRSEPRCRRPPLREGRQRQRPPAARADPGQRRLG